MMKKALFFCTLLTAAIFCSCGQVDEPLEENSDSQVSAETETTAEETTASNAEVTTEPATTTEAETISVEATTAQNGQSENGNYEDSHTISPGLWLSTYMSQSGMRSQAYYEIRSDGTGLKVYQQNGRSEYFDYGIEGSTMIFDFGGASPVTAEIDFITSDLNTLHFDDLTTEEWSWYSDGKLSELNFYTNDELCEMAREYFNASDGRECNDTESYIGENDTVMINLFEDSDGEHTLINVYYIDRYTADGYNWDNTYIDLTDIPQ